MVPGSQDDRGVIVTASCLRTTAGLLALAPCLLAAQVVPCAESHQVMADGYYAREISDREWHLRLVGEIPSLCGALILIHDASGTIIHQGVVPHGAYPADKPYEVAIKPDGKTGDYKIVLIGHQNDKMGVMVPYTDLPFEVYGGATFALRDGVPHFRAPPGVARMKLGAYRGHLQVLDQAGKVVADTRVGGVLEKYDNTIEFDVHPGETYRLRLECFYFINCVPGSFFIAFDPARWFCPTSTLDQVKWWEGGK